MDSMIRVEDLQKSYGTVHAVQGVTFQVCSGQVFALLGPNGAGKSTIINMLSTLLHPDSGTITIAGLDVVRQADAVRAIIGATFQDIVLDRDLTGYEVLDFAGRLYRMPAHTRSQRITELLAMVELTDAAQRRTDTYSGGMKRRLELARCLMTAPRVLFLDEPTQGLDPLHRVMIWQYIEELRSSHGMTVILTTHAMDEAERLADDVGIIDHGQLVVHGSPQVLIQTTGSERITVEANFGTAYQPDWRQQPWIQTWDCQDSVLRIGVDHGSQRLGSIIGWLNQDGITPSDIRMTQPSLADVFLQVTGRTYRDEVQA